MYISGCITHTHEQGPLLVAPPPPEWKLPLTTISLAEVRRRLAVGTEFIGEFIGGNAFRAAPGLKKTRRSVVSNSAHQMVSKFIDGPKLGQNIYCTWKGHTAEVDADGCIIVTQPGYDHGSRHVPPERFLKITLIK